jgi:hypothetical protein
MQVATVYLNGSQIGVHNNSGYTAFTINISNNMVRGGNNVLAVRLNNQKSADIPPGWANAGPDYNLYGGLHSSVWLHFKDSVYVPVYQQFIRTQNVSASSAQVRAITPVRNARPSAQTVAVTVNVLNASQTIVSTQTSALSIPANTLDTFDMTLPAISNPALWSPSNPNMYSVQTLVRIGTAVVDSVVEPCGFRWFTWSTSNGFSINGTRMEIRGVCVHKALAWIENAVPDQKYYHEVKVIKAMGCNSIRCAHYPRPQAFYDACDRLGMLCYPEIPSWGWSLNPNTTCWARLDSCTREMVLAARNHPSIYLWGLYNEPNRDNNPQDFTPYITTMNNTAHALDPTRLTTIANNPSGTLPTCMVVPDVLGLNYSTGHSVTINGKNTANMPWLNCESRNPGTFGTRDFRGSSVDLDTSETANCAGSAGNDRCEWDSFTDYPRPGTATHIDFRVDTNSLPADSVNVFLLTAALRDGSNRQISSDSNCTVTFTLSDPTKGVIFGGNRVKPLGGKAAAYLRTSKSPGTFTVTASVTCRTMSSPVVTLTTTPVPPETYEIPTGVRPSDVQAMTATPELKVTHASNGIIFRCPRSDGHLRVIDCQGRTVYSQDVRSGASLFVSRLALGAGLFHAVWENGKQRLVSRVLTSY